MWELEDSEIRLLGLGNESPQNKFVLRLKHFQEGILQNRLSDFDPTLDWFNSVPLSFQRELNGKLIVADFWTYCCVNCLHTMKDIHWLQEKWANHPEIVFIGVHSGKFSNEKLSDNILQAILRNNISYPVVNDPSMKHYTDLSLEGWPSLVLIGPTQEILIILDGEGNRKKLDTYIQLAYNFYKEKLNVTPIPIQTHTLKTVSPLRFPGKLLVDENKKLLFISDSGNNRIVVTNLKGKSEFVIGSGIPGMENGNFKTARFNAPQGLALVGTKLYVCDTNNHAIRCADLEDGMVSTIAGDGHQGKSDFLGGNVGIKQKLNSPWDIIADSKNRLYIAMAGIHAIWTLDLDTHVCQRHCGSSLGRELNRNGNEQQTAWAQPSGLCWGPNHELYVADSESSCIRCWSPQTMQSSPVVGGAYKESLNLMAMGDLDGQLHHAKLQHPMAVMRLKLKDELILCDTYNHKLKLLNIENNSIRKFAGSGKPGLKEGIGELAEFSEPSGLSSFSENGQEWVFVADTNNHVIRVVDMGTGIVRTMELDSVPLPQIEKKIRSWATKNTTIIPIKGNFNSNKIVLSFNFSPGYHLSPDAPSSYQVILPKLSPISISETTGVIKEKETIIPISGYDEENSFFGVQVEVQVFYCSDKGLCKMKVVVFRISFEMGDTGDTVINVDL